MKKKLGKLKKKSNLKKNKKKEKSWGKKEVGKNHYGLQLL